MCDSCEYDGQIYSPTLEICKVCFKKEPKVLITQTDATKKYPVSKSDLETVRRIEYKGVYETYLFMIKDIATLCIAKYGNEKAVKEAIMNKNKKVKERKHNAENLRNVKRKELDTYLKSICLEGVRDDSTLCTNYIERADNGNLTKEQIGEIMLEMQFFHNETDYSTLLYKMRGDEFAAMREYGEYHKWTDSDEEELRTEAKNDALYKYVKDNYNNSHELIISIPKSLKQQADMYYAKLSKQLNHKAPTQQTQQLSKQQTQQTQQAPTHQNKPKQVIDITDILQKYNESKIKFGKTQDAYDKINF